MQVDNLPGELLKEGRAEDPHPASQDDEVYLKQVEERGKFFFAERHSTLLTCRKLRSSIFLPWQVDNRQLMFKGALHTLSLGVIADDQGNLNARKLFGLDGIDERLQVAATTRDKYAQA